MSDVIESHIDPGRKHQVRRHLAGLGHPVIGDRHYGLGADDGVDLQLTAWRLAFDCPVAGVPVVYQLDAWTPRR